MPTTAAPPLLVLELARVHVTYHRLELSLPSRCRNCNRPLLGEGGAGVAVLFLEQRVAPAHVQCSAAALASVEPTPCAQPLAADQRHPVALRCAGCGELLLGEAPRVLGTDARVDSHPKTAQQLMDFLAVVGEPSALVLLSREEAGSSFAPLHQVTTDTAHVSGDGWSPAVELESTHPEASPALVLWPRS
jgi:hypothetical protein